MGETWENAGYEPTNTRTKKPTRLSINLKESASLQDFMQTIAFGWNQGIKLNYGQPFNKQKNALPQPMTRNGRALKTKPLKPTTGPGAGTGFTNP